VWKRGNDSSLAVSRLLVNMLLEGTDEFGAIFGQISGFITDTEMEKS
jgi:hypothetical protein